MVFSEIFGRTCDGDDARSRIITDGQFSCSYADAPTALKQIEIFLTEQGIDRDVCVAVECINSLAGAFLILALFQRGNSFVLTPSSQDAELKPTPHFCRHRLRVLPAESADSGKFSPVTHLRSERNMLFNGRSTPPSKLYLRTSGSIGISKLVVHSHEKLLGNAANCISRYGFSAASRAVIPVPIAHMYGLGAEFLPAVMSGASIDLQEKTNLLKYLSREKHFRPTIVFATPAICEMLLVGYKTPRSNYHVFVTSGQRIGENLFRNFDSMVSGRLVNQYGSTELGAAAGCLPGDALELRATTIGAPMPGVQLRLDPLPAEDWLEGETGIGKGELCCNHPCGFEGYVDEDGEWIGKAPHTGWYRTGDVGMTQSDGSIVIVGRAAAGVNRRGYLVSLSDIERRMEKLPALSEVVVVAAAVENKQGQRIAAFCVLRQGSDLDGTQVRRQCFDLLPHYAVPDEVHVVTAGLPLLPSGKVDRRSLAALVDG